MRIACPSCAAEYEVPTSRLPPHKMVRCARCGGEWVPVREVIEAAPEHTAEVSTQSLESDPDAAFAQPPLDADTPDHAQDPGPGPVHSGSLQSRVAWSARTVWIVTCMIIAFAGVLAATTIAWKAEIVRPWPKTGHFLGQTVQKSPVPEDDLSDPD